MADTGAEFSGRINMRSAALSVVMAVQPQASTCSKSSGDWLAIMDSRAPMQADFTWHGAAPQAGQDL